MKTVAKVTGEFFIDMEDLKKDPLFIEMVNEFDFDDVSETYQESVKKIEEVISDYILTSDYLPRVESDNFKVEIIEYDN